MSMDEALARLREEDARREAPRRVEVAVLAAYRGYRRRSSSRWWMAAAAAALLIGAVLWLRPRATPEIVARAPDRQVDAAVKVIPPERSSQPMVSPRRAAIRRHRPRRTVPPIEAQFSPVPYAPPLPSGEIQVVRVRLAAAGTQFGAEAEVVTGVDGIVRAVRWIR
jgi:hypothetical protein